MLVRCAANDGLTDSSVRAERVDGPFGCISTGQSVEAEHTIGNCHELMLWAGDWVLRGDGHIASQAPVRMQKRVSVPSVWTRELTLDLLLK